LHPPEGIPKNREGYTNELKVATKAALFDNNDGNSKAFPKHLRSFSSTSTRIADVQILAPGTVASAITPDSPGETQRSRASQHGRFEM
jgi:hypothetical protein